MVELYVVTTLVSVAIFAYTNVLTKIFVDRTGGPIQWLIAQLSFELPILLAAYFIYSGIGLQTTDIVSLGYILLSSIFAFIGFVFLILGFQKGNASVGGVILAIRVVFSIPLAYLFIGEVYSVFTYVALFFAIIGGIIVSYQPDMKITDLILLRAKGIKYFLATTFFWAISNFLVRKLDNGDSIDAVLFFLATRQVIMFILGVITYSIARKKFNAKKITIDSNNLLGIIVYVLSIAVAQFLFVYALGENLTITEGIGVLEGGFTFIYSILIARIVSNKILNEPLDTKTGAIRFLGVVISTLGTLFAIISSS